MARLARLRLTAGEVARFTEQLGEIFEYFERLDGVDTTGVEPFTHPRALTNVLREDDVVPGLSHEQALGNAPQARGGHFCVPRVLGSVGEISRDRERGG